MINTVKDTLLLMKDSTRSRLFSNARIPLADALIAHLDLRGVQRIIHGKPNTIVIVTRNMVVRVPLDKLSETRCRVNNMMLKKLTKTSIASLVPRSLEVGKFNGLTYYCESRHPGVAIDLPISRMDDMVVKAADFITKFHQETARDIMIDESNFKRLFGREFARFYPYLDDGYRMKLKTIEDSLKKELIGKPFKTVWLHGDYKIENILFDTKKWQIRGIIDWDLSRREGLPLLDIFYLLVYNEKILTKKNLTDIFAHIFFDFTANDNKIIGRYRGLTKISNQFLKPMLVMAWITHIVERCKQQFIINPPLHAEWLVSAVYSKIDIVLEIYRKESGISRENFK